MTAAARIAAPDARRAAPPVQRSAAAALEDRRPQAAAAQALAHAVHAGPRMTAQRKALLRWTGAPAVAQLELPKDGSGTINKLVRINQGGELKEVNPAVLQYDILNLVWDLRGGRLGSFFLDRDKNLTRKLKDDPYKDEAHGMTPLPENFPKLKELDDAIQPFIRATLAEAGQLQYIEQNADAIFASHRVIIDVDCQINRTGQIGFHKDSRGTTAFVNLTFHSNEPITGTDHYEDLEGEPGLEEDLPQVLRDDINARRLAKGDVARGQDEQAKADVRDIQSPELPKYGRLSFSDPNNYHSTPLMGHRKATGQESLELMRAVLKSKRPNINWDAQPPEEVRQAYPYAAEVGYSLHNVEDKAVSNGQLDAETQRLAKVEALAKAGVRAEASKTRVRRLSTRLNQQQTSQDALNQEATKPRTFIRTWVRFIPRAVQ